MILRCANCKRYTIKSKCPNCGSEELENIHPPKFSLQDKYIKIKFFYILKRKQKLK